MPHCIGGVADGNFSNDGVRDLDSTCLWDYRHLEKKLGEDFEQIDVILRQVYTNTTFTPDNYERTFAHYSRLITEDVIMRTETKILCQQQLEKIKKVCGRYFSVSQEPLTLFNVNNNILETAGLKFNNYADKYGGENGYGDDDKRRVWLLSATLEDIKLPRPPPPAPAPAPEDPQHDAPGPDRRTGGMRGMQRHMPMYRRQT